MQSDKLNESIKVRDLISVIGNLKDKFKRLKALKLKNDDVRIGCSLFRNY
jgi:hypothetical protein